MVAPFDPREFVRVATLHSTTGRLIGQLRRQSPSEFCHDCARPADLFTVGQEDAGVDVLLVLARRTKDSVMTRLITPGRPRSSPNSPTSCLRRISSPLRLNMRRASRSENSWRTSRGNSCVRRIVVFCSNMLNPTTQL